MSQLPGSATVAQAIAALSAMQGVNQQANLAGVLGAPTASSDIISTQVAALQTRKNELAANLTAGGNASAGTETLAALIAKVSDAKSGKAVLSSMSNLTRMPMGYRSEIGTSGYSYAKAAIDRVNNVMYYGQIVGNGTIYKFNFSTGALTASTNNASMNYNNMVQMFLLGTDNLYVVDNNAIYRYSSALSLSATSASLATIKKVIYDATEDVLYVFSHNKIYKVDKTTLSTLATLYTDAGADISAGCYDTNYFYIYKETAKVARKIKRSDSSTTWTSATFTWIGRDIQFSTDGASIIVSTNTAATAVQKINAATGAISATGSVTSGAAQGLLVYKGYIFVCGAAGLVVFDANLVKLFELPALTIQSANTNMDYLFVESGILYAPGSQYFSGTTSFWFNLQELPLTFL